ncbi:hypothetical protein SH2C18_18680 [Clostridium sediminicola]|uniref:hypothetical protein n=1 Tax=Clostridium sediminicola TaxID=3114879 RepID=UPI0031F1F0B2
MIDTRITKYLAECKREHIEFAIRCYAAGLGAYIGVFMLNQSYIEVALIIGVINYFFSEPIINTIKYGKNSNKSLQKFGIIKNILLSLIIVSIIAGIHNIFYKFMEISIEPISFAIIYQIIYQLLFKIKTLFVNDK